MATPANLLEPVDLINIADKIESSSASQWRELSTLLCFSPGLKCKREEEPRLAWPHARRDAARQTVLPPSTFLEIYSFAVEEVEDEEPSG